MKFVLPTPPTSSSSFALSGEEEDTLPPPSAKLKIPPQPPAVRPQNKKTTAPSTRPPSRMKPDASQEVSPEVFPYNESSINVDKDEEELLVVAHLLLDYGDNADNDDVNGDRNIAPVGRPPSPYLVRSSPR